MLQHVKLVTIQLQLLHWGIIYNWTFFLQLLWQ